MESKKMILAIDYPKKWIPNKQSIEEAAYNFLQPLIDGEVNVEDVAIQLDAIKKVVEKIEKQARPIISRHVHTKYSRGEKVSIHGCTIERMDVGKYDYSVCGDEYYNELKKQLEELSEKIKKREKFLQAIPEGKFTIVANEDTGELMELHAPLRLSNETYKIKFPDGLNGFTE